MRIDSATLFNQNWLNINTVIVGTASLFTVAGLVYLVVNRCFKANPPQTAPVRQPEKEPAPGVPTENNGAKTTVQQPVRPILTRRDETAVGGSQPKSVKFPGGNRPGLSKRVFGAETKTAVPPLALGGRVADIKGARKLPERNESRINIHRPNDSYGSGRPPLNGSRPQLPRPVPGASFEPRTGLVDSRKGLDSSSSLPSGRKEHSPPATPLRAENRLPPQTPAIAKSGLPFETPGGGDIDAISMRKEGKEALMQTFNSNIHKGLLCFVLAEHMNFLQFYDEALEEIVHGLKILEKDHCELRDAFIKLQAQCELLNAAEERDCLDNSKIKGVFTDVGIMKKPAESAQKAPLSHLNHLTKYKELRDILRDNNQLALLYYCIAADLMHAEDFENARIANLYGRTCLPTEKQETLRKFKVQKQFCKFLQEAAELDRVHNNIVAELKERLTQYEASKKQDSEKYVKLLRDMYQLRTAQEAELAKAKLSEEQFEKYKQRVEEQSAEYGRQLEEYKAKLDKQAEEHVAALKQYEQERADYERRLQQQARTPHKGGEGNGDVAFLTPTKSGAPPPAGPPPPPPPGPPPLVYVAPIITIKVKKFDGEIAAKEKSDDPTRPVLTDAMLTSVALKPATERKIPPRKTEQPEGLAALSKLRPRRPRSQSSANLAPSSETAATTPLVVQRKKTANPFLKLQQQKKEANLEAEALVDDIFKEKFEPKNKEKTTPKSPAKLKQGSNFTVAQSPSKKNGKQGSFFVE